MCETARLIQNFVNLNIFYLVKVLELNGKYLYVTVEWNPAFLCTVKFAESDLTRNFKLLLPDRSRTHSDGQLLWAKRSQPTFDIPSKFSVLEIPSKK